MQMQVDARKRAFEWLSREDPSDGVPKLPEELVAVDRLLDDPAFFEPYRAHFDPVWSRPSVPLESYLRLMFLASRHSLSFEAVVREAGDSLSWRRSLESTRLLTGPSLTIGLNGQPRRTITPKDPGQPDGPHIRT